MVRISRIGEYVERIFDSDWFGKTASVIATSSALLAVGLQTYVSIRAMSPNPPIYRDVNGDGIVDKIVQRRVEKSGGIPFTTYYTLEREVLLGIEIGGKRLYLPRDQFEEYKR